MNQPPAPLSHRVDRPVPPGKAAASDAPVRRLWQLRWNVAARAARMGYAVLSLEPDTFVTEDVYQAGGERRWGWLGGCMGGRGGGGGARRRRGCARSWRARCWLEILSVRVFGLDHTVHTPPRALSAPPLHARAPCSLDAAPRGPQLPAMVHPRALTAACGLLALLAANGAGAWSRAALRCAIAAGRRGRLGGAARSPRQRRQAARQRRPAPHRCTLLGVGVHPGAAGERWLQSDAVLVGAVTRWRRALPPPPTPHPTPLSPPPCAHPPPSRQVERQGLPHLHPQVWRLALLYRKGQQRDRGCAGGTPSPPPLSPARPPRLLAHSPCCTRAPPLPTPHSPSACSNPAPPQHTHSITRPPLKSTRAPTPRPPPCTAELMDAVSQCLPDYNPNVQLQVGQTICLPPYKESCDYPFQAECR